MLLRTVSGIAALAVALCAPGAPLHAQTAPATAREISLMPGDVLRVQIWREPDLSGDFQVEPDGEVVLPLLGERKVVDTPVDRLRSELIEAYSAHLRNPSISITPLRRVNVLGEVRTAGMYPMDPTVSLAGAVALAGGATAIGDLRRIRIVRGGEVIRSKVGVGETLAAADIRSGDEIIVDRRSWFDRNSTFMVSTMLSVTSIVIAILRN